MSSATNRHLESLDVDACLELLGQAEIGRLAFVEDDAPVVLPVNYLLDRGAVVVRTAEGSKLSAAVRQERVAFEIDSFDVQARVGWSVLVKGVAAEIWESRELELARGLPLEPWAPGTKDHYLVILSTSITGRRLTAPADGDDTSSATDLWWG